MYNRTNERKMYRSPNLKEKYLDGEILFRQYYAMGEARSINRLTKFAISQGMTSSTGKLPTTMGVWKSIWRWASLKENRDTAWKIYKESTNKTFAEWIEYMRDNIRTAWQHPTEAKYTKFLKDNGWS